MIDPEEVQVLLAQSRADRMVGHKLVKLRKLAENDPRSKEDKASIPRLDWLYHTSCMVLNLLTQYQWPFQGRSSHMIASPPYI